MFRLLLINYHLFGNFHFDYVYLYVGGARDFWYEKSGAWVKKVGKHWIREFTYLYDVVNVH